MRATPLLLTFALLLACREDGDPKYSQDADKDGVRSDEDCDDANPSLGLPGLWYTDADGDSYGGGAPVEACVPPDGAVETDGDCDDADPEISPGAAELCDGLDQDCDGVIDNGFDVVVTYTDADGDGYGDDTTAVESCDPAAGSVTLAGDCDDADPAFHPDAAETDCTDPNDYNCDGSVGYADADADGQPACTDCNDADAAVFPGATETCDGIDQDCDGSIDEDATDIATWYADLDGDSFGDAGSETLACSAPEGAVADHTDCVDGDAAVHPGAEERCDGVDQDCDGEIDEEAVDAGTWYADADTDGYGVDTSATVACDAPADHSAFSGDCNDADPAYNPGADESDCSDPNDYNCDGASGFADRDEDGYAACEECDDGNPAIYPGATEVCDGVDNNCDGEPDEATAVDASTWYADTDVDGYGDPDQSTQACTAPAGYVADNTDCDDLSAEVHPGRTEVCNGIDDDCDGEVDEDDAADASDWYSDSDGDGYGDAGSVTVACEAPAGAVGDSTDCDDGAAAVNPGADEVCDEIDNNCDGNIDEGAAFGSSWYADSDGDGYGDPASETIACEAPSGSVADRTDCDDSSAAVSPGGEERCNGIDDDCDGTTDEADATDASTWYTDGDSDGFGDPSTGTTACDAPAGSTDVAGDCDDADASVSPDGVEVCDGIDNDCVAGVDDGFDADSDGLADCFDTEACDGIDNDGDGLTDEAGATGESSWYADTDGDGYGDPATTLTACDAPAGTVADNNDCDDSDADVSPAGTEYCDGRDEDCDGGIDEFAVDTTTWYADADGDGFGDDAATTDACEPPSGSVSDNTDCDDNDADVYPGAEELCDGVDGDCDTTLSWLEEDSDADTLLACEEALWLLNASAGNNDPAGTGASGSSTAAGMMPAAGLTLTAGGLLASATFDATLLENYGTLVIAGNATEGGFDSTESAALEAWVSGGGNLVYIGYHPTAATCAAVNTLPAGFGIRCPGVGGYWSGTASTIVAHPVTSGVTGVAGLGGEYWTVSAPATAVVSLGSDPVVIVAEYGDGRVVAVSDEWFAYNAGTGSADISAASNQQLVANIWSWAAEHELP